MPAFAAAGLDGVRRKLDPGEPKVRKNMYRLSLEDVKGGKLGFIPQSLAEAIASFQADSVVQRALGPGLAAKVATVKGQEWVRYHNTVSRREIDHSLTVF